MCGQLILSAILYSFILEFNERLCSDRKARTASAQGFKLWQQATMEITCHDHSPRTLVITFNRSQVIGRDYTPRSLYYCLFAPHMYGCCSSLTFRSWWIAYST